MTLDTLRPLSNRAIVPFVSVATRIGLTANAVTVTAVITAAAAGITLIVAGTNQSWYLLGSALVLFTGFLDVLDGALARATDSATDFGDFLDHVLDRYGDVLILGGLAIGADQYILGMFALTGILLTANLGTQGHALDLGRIYGGLLGRADILVLVGVSCAVATVFNPPLALGLDLVEWLLVVLAVGTHLTALQRFVWSWQELRER